MQYGIDVSKHQGSIDWPQTAAALRQANGGQDPGFALLRAGYGNTVAQKDDQIEDSHQNEGMSVRLDKSNGHSICDRPELDRGQHTEYIQIMPSFKALAGKSCIYHKGDSRQQNDAEDHPPPGVGKSNKAPTSTR